MDFDQGGADNVYMSPVLHTNDRVFVFFILSLVTLGVSIVISLWPSTPPLDVLRSESPQTVENSHRGPESALIGEPLRVTAEKCNDADRPVRVVGSAQWEPISPRGAAVGRVEGTNDRLNGCKTEQFTNSISMEVVSVMEKQLRNEVDPGNPVIWRLFGTESVVGFVECHPVEKAKELDEFNIGIIEDGPVCTNEGEASVVVEEVTNSATGIWFTDNVSVYAE